MSVAEKLGLKLGTRKIVLPSNGIYGGETEVTVRPFVTRDEKYITGIDINTGEKSLQQLASSVVIDPEDLEIENLLDADLVFILLVARCLTYGDEVTAQYRCSKCGTDNTHTLNLFDHDIKLLTADEFNVKLDVSSMKITYEILTIGKRNNLEAQIRQKYNLMKKTVDDEEVEIRALATAVKQVKKGNKIVKLTPEEKYDLINNFLTKADMDQWADSIQENSVNPDFIFDGTCRACDAINNRRLVISPDFFFTRTSTLLSLPLKDYSFSSIS